MSKTKKLFALLLSGAMCFSLAFAAACGGGSDSDGDGDGDGDGGTPAVQTTTATVTYDSNGGSSVDASTVEVGSTLGTLPTPTRTGYNFVGWYYTYGSMEVKVTGDYPIPCDVTLTAKWSEQSDFYLSFQSDLVVETGDLFYFRMYDTDIDANTYVMITKGDTTKTVDEAISAGWIIDSDIEVEYYYDYEYSYSTTSSGYLYSNIYFGQPGDYTITAYSYSQTCSTVVTVTGDTVTSLSSDATFTDSTVSVDKITYLDTDYTNGGNIALYSEVTSEYVYVYFNAPAASEARVTYSYTDTETNTTKTGLLGTTYEGISSSYENGQFIIYFRPTNLNVGYTYTVKVNSVSNGSAEATFTCVEPAAATENKILTTPETSATVWVYNTCYDSYYVLSTAEISGGTYSVKDSEGNTLTDAGVCDVESGFSGYGLYEIAYSGYFYTAGVYTLTITPCDIEGTELTALAQTVTVTVLDSGSSTNAYWSVVSTDSDGNYIKYYNRAIIGESKTIQYTANAELDKVAVCGVYINTSNATTITKYNGTTISAIYSVADGKTTVSLTIKAVDDGYINMYLIGSNADGSVCCDISPYFNVISSEEVAVLQNKISSVIYSLKTYFSEQIAEGGELNELYTKLSAYSTLKTYAACMEADDLIDDICTTIDNLETEVYDSDTDYTSSLATALASKTSICESVLCMYNYYYGSGTIYILMGSEITSDYDLFLLGMERYALIETSDKDICDGLYYVFFTDSGADEDEMIERYDERYNGTVSALVEAHRSGTEAEYIAAMNTFLLTVNNLA